MNKINIETFNNQKNDIVNRFQIFIKDSDLTSNSYIDSGKQLLQDICAQGRYLSNTVERNQFAQMARDVNSRLFDLTDEYLSAHLETLDHKIIKIERGINHAIPLQFPPRPEHFTNRQIELKKLFKNLKHSCVITLCGPGGIGKTALATEAVWQLHSDKKFPEIFPDGIIFHSFYGRPETAYFFEHVIRSFDREARDFSCDEAFRILSGKKALLMLDGTEEADDLGKVLDIRGQCGVIVTSRQKKDAISGREDITSLPTDEAVKLLRAWSGCRAENEEDSRQICEIVGGLPLAVRLAGKYLFESGESESNYLEWLKKTPLEALDHRKRKLESVPLLLKGSLNQVGQTAQQILGLCGQLTLSSFSWEMVSAVFPDIQIRMPLNELIFYSLLKKSGDRFEISHPLIHTYACTELLPDKEVFKRLKNYLNNFAREQSEKGLDGYVQIDPERAHILKIIKTCAERKNWQDVTALVWAVYNYLEIRGYGTDIIAALETGIIAARELKDQRDEGAFTSNLGLAYYSLGQMDKAIEYHEQALTIVKEIGDRRAEGNQTGNLGLAYYSLGQVDKAIEYYQLALTIAKETGDRRAEGNALGNLGLAYSDLGQVDKAIEYFQMALTIARETGDRRAEGNALGNLGLAYYSLGQVDKAIEYYQLALTIAKETGDRRAEGNALGNLGLAYSDLGQMDKAIEYFQMALTIARETGDRRAEGSDLGNLGNAYKNLGQVDKAIEYYQLALTIVKEIGDRRAEGNQTGNLGSAYSELGQVDKAIEYYQLALTIAREIGDRRGEGNALGNLGSAYSELGQVDKARQYMKQSIAIFEEIKSPNANIVREWLTELSEQKID